jgi:dihydrofolate synthase/folylpolyglutamate synthase
MGLLANKDARGVLAPLKALNPRLIFTGFSADAAARPEDLQAVARELGMEAEVCGDVEHGLRTALGAEGPAPRVLICGSLYLAGEVLNLSPETWPV